MTGQSIVKATPVPAALAEVGVRIGHDEASGMAVVVIPRQVREKLNVIDPVSSFAQADPNWTPRISVVELDPDPKNGSHFYEQAGRKLAPTKQALETLAKGAGVLYTRTERVPRAELDEGEIGYRATVGIRRSDGTIEEVSRERIWVHDAERAEIEDAVTRAEEWAGGNRTGKPKFDIPDSPTWAAEVQKRWLKELKDRSAKTESKAVLRAIRAALQIPHTFTAAEAQKPFLIIGFNFTPDYNDHETKRLLVAAGLNAQAAIYGTRATGSDETPAALPAGTDTTTDETTTSPPPPAEQSTVDADVQQAAAAASNPPAAAAPGPDDEEPALDEPSPFQAPTSARVEDDPVVAAGRAAAQFEIPAGQHKGLPLSELLQKGDKGTSWLRWALKKGDQLTPDEYRTAVWSFARVYVPELYTEVLAEHEAAS